MVRFGYTLMTGQNGPKDLVRHAVAAERRAPDLTAVVDAARVYWQAGFTDIAVLQIGGETQQRFLDEAAEPLLAAQRSAAG